MKSPPPENQTMKKASVISVVVTTFFYLSCGCAGYAAFGSDTPGNLLTGFGSSEFYWLLIFANVCIVVHLVGSYQVHLRNTPSNFIIVLAFYMLYLYEIILAYTYLGSFGRVIYVLLTYIYYYYLRFTLQKTMQFFLLNN